MIDKTTLKDSNTIFKALELFEIISYREVFSSSESGLFLALIHHWNRSGRPKVFSLWNTQLHALSGLKTDKTIQSARDRLISRGVIYSDKAGNRSERRYSFDALFSLPSPLLSIIPVKSTSNRDSKWQVSGGVNGIVNGESPQGEVKDKDKEDPLAPKGGKELELELEVEESFPHGLKFKEAWSDWLDHLKQKRKKPTPQTKKLQLKKLKNMNESDAIVMIYHSIERGYQGLFPPNNQKSSSLNTSMQNPQEYY